jgi:hypothetical protein
MFMSVHIFFSEQKFFLEGGGLRRQESQGDVRFCPAPTLLRSVGARQRELFGRNRVKSVQLGICDTQSRA